MGRSTSRTIRIISAGVLSLFMLAVSSLPSIAAPRDYRIDPEHASFGFLVSHFVPLSFCAS